MEPTIFKVKDTRSQLCFFLQINQYKPVEYFQFAELKSVNFLSISNGLYKKNETNESMLRELLTKIGQSDLRDIKYSFEMYTLQLEEKNKIKNEIAFVRQILFDNKQKS